MITRRPRDLILSSTPSRKRRRWVSSSLTADAQRLEHTRELGRRGVATNGSLDRRAESHRLSTGVSSSRTRAGWRAPRGAAGAPRPAHESHPVSMSRSARAMSQCGAFARAAHAHVEPGPLCACAQNRARARRSARSRCRGRAAHRPRSRGPSSSASKSGIDALLPGAHDFQTRAAAPPRPQSPPGRDRHRSGRHPDAQRVIASACPPETDGAVDHQARVIVQEVLLHLRHHDGYVAFAAHALHAGRSASAAGA